MSSKNGDLNSILDFRYLIKFQIHTLAFLTALVDMVAKSKYNNIRKKHENNQK